MQQAYKLSTLYSILDQKNIKDSYFLTRMGANFPIISDLFEQLYQHHPHKEEAFRNLIDIITESFENRSSSLKETDLLRSKKPNWYSSEEIVGMMLYTERFNKNFKGLQDKIPYFKMDLIILKF